MWNSENEFTGTNNTVVHIVSGNQIACVAVVAAESSPLGQARLVRCGRGGGQLKRRQLSPAGFSVARGGRHGVLLTAYCRGGVSPLSLFQRMLALRVRYIRSPWC